MDRDIPMTRLRHTIMPWLDPRASFSLNSGLCNKGEKWLSNCPMFFFIKVKKSKDTIKTVDTDLLFRC